MWPRGKGQNPGLGDMGLQSRPWQDGMLRVRRKGILSIPHPPSQRRRRALESQPFMVQPWQRVSFCSHNDSAHTLDFRRAGLPPLSADQGPRKLGHGSLVHPSLIHLILPLPTGEGLSEYRFSSWKTGRATIPKFDPNSLHINRNF